MANVWLGNGRFTRDPEIRHTAEGNCIARWTLAVKRNMSSTNDEAQDTDFISCVAFGKTAEHVEKYFSKGKSAIVNGRLTTGSYTDRDGKKVYTTDVVVNHIEFGESKAAENAAFGRTSTQSQAPVAQVQVKVQPQQAVTPTATQPQARVTVAQPQTTNDGFMTIPEEVKNNLPWS